NVGTSSRSAADIWLKHPDRRKYEGVVYDPTGKQARQYELNLWSGFAVTPRPGSWELMKKHLHSVLCSGSDAQYNYLIAKLAEMVENPHKQGRVVIVLRGKQGIGKGILGTTMCSFYGPHALHLSGPEHLLGRFNDHLEGKSFIFVDEAFWAGDKKHLGALKR